MATSALCWWQALGPPGAPAPHQGPAEPGRPLGFPVGGGPGRALLQWHGHLLPPLPRAPEDSRPVSRSRPQDTHRPVRRILCKLSAVTLNMGLNLHAGFSIETVTVSSLQFS